MFIVPFITSPNDKGIIRAAADGGNHNSGIPPHMKLANTPGLRLKSVDEREQVSLSVPV
ncbi:MAG: hypothetical protein VB111_11660 [Clostridiaceae bacterium]|nr:hypothetical protein [Clostridiaceae bacterium]